MTDRETLYRGLSHAAWGYFFLYLNFNLTLNTMTINVLPQFVGLLFLLSAIKKLQSERQDLLLLRPLGILLGVWHFGDWVLALAGNRLEDMNLIFLDLLVLAVTLYFNFQFLTDIAALAEKYQPEGERLDRDIRGYRTDLLLLTTASSLLSNLMDAWKQFFHADWVSAMALAMAVCLVIITLILIVLLMMALFRLRRCVQEENGPI